MAKIVIWNREASDSFEGITDYLQENWGDTVTRNFVMRALKIIDLIAEYPEMGTLEEVDKQIRGFVITKHNTLFYRVEDDNIKLLTFFDNRQHPSKRIFL